MIGSLSDAAKILTSGATGEEARSGAVCRFPQSVGNPGTRHIRPRFRSFLDLPSDERSAGHEYDAAAAWAAATRNLSALIKDLSRAINALPPPRF